MILMDQNFNLTVLSDRLGDLEMKTMMTMRTMMMRKLMKKKSLKSKMKKKMMMRRMRYKLLLYCGFDTNMQFTHVVACSVMEVTCLTVTTAASFWTTIDEVSQ